MLRVSASASATPPRKSKSQRSAGKAEARAKADKLALSLLNSQLPQDDPAIQALNLLEADRRIVQKGLLKRQGDSWRDSDNQLHVYLLDNAFLMLEYMPQKGKELKKKFSLYRQPVLVTALSAIAGGESRTSFRERSFRKLQRFLSILTGRVTRQNYIEAPSTPKLDAITTASSSSTSSERRYALGYAITFKIHDKETGDVLYEQILYAPSLRVRVAWLEAVKLSSPFECSSEVKTPDESATEPVSTATLPVLLE